jgi:hypothetical protein
LQGSSAVVAGVAVDEQERVVGCGLGVHMQSRVYMAGGSMAEACRFAGLE